MSGVYIMAGPDDDGCSGESTRKHIARDKNSFPLFEGSDVEYKGTRYQVHGAGSKSNLVILTDGNETFEVNTSEVTLKL